MCERDEINELEVLGVPKSLENFLSGVNLDPNGRVFLVKVDGAVVDRETIVSFDRCGYGRWGDPLNKIEGDFFGSAVVGKKVVYFFGKAPGEECQFYLGKVGNATSKDFAAPLVVRVGERKLTEQELAFLRDNKLSWEEKRK